MTQKTYKTLLDSVDKKERNEGKGDFYSYIKTEDIPSDIKDFLINLIYSDDGIDCGDNNLAYNILYDATAFMSEYTLKEFLKLDIYDAMIKTEQASIYNGDRLGYLNINNEYDIKNILEEYQCESINQACAIYYDGKVKETVEKLQDYCKNN